MIYLSFTPRISFLSKNSENQNLDQALERKFIRQTPIRKKKKEHIIGKKLYLVQLARFN